MELDLSKDENIDIIFSSLTLQTNNEAQSQLIELSYKLKSNLYPIQFEGAFQIRKMTSEKSPPLKELIFSNIIPELISMCYVRPIEFIYEVCWILCNVATGDTECVCYLINNKVLDFYEWVFCIEYANFEMKDIVIWAIGNIAGDSADFRDLIVSSRIFSLILAYSNTLPIFGNEKDMNLTWTFCILCKIPPSLPKSLTIKLEPRLMQVLLYNDHKAILNSACYGLSFISLHSDNFSNYTQRVLKRLLETLFHKSSSVSIPTCKILNNFLLYSISSWEHIKGLGLTTALIEKIKNTKNLTLKTELYKTLSNISDDKGEVARNMREQGVYEYLIQIIDKENNKIANNIIWTLMNSTQNANPEEFQYLSSLGWPFVILNYLNRNISQKHKYIALRVIINLLHSTHHFFHKDFISKINQLDTKINQPEIILDIITQLEQIINN